MLDGSKKNVHDFSGDLLMVVNVASRCGLAPQYETLEALHKKYASRGFTVLGVPSGSFMQELKNSEDISEYCSTTWGISFPMLEKADVNGRKRHPLYKELVKTKDGMGLAGPVMWNFEKFLVAPDARSCDLGHKPSRTRKKSSRPLRPTAALILPHGNNGGGGDHSGF